MKIAVMGYSGAGKSTLAKKLGRLYDCPGRSKTYGRGIFE